MLILVLPSFLVQSWKITLVYVWYYANRDVIAEKFCENLDRPELMCSGKCHIQKIIEQVKNDRDQWKKSARNSVDERSITLIHENENSEKLKKNLPDYVTGCFYYQPPFSVKGAQSVFRPPKSSLLS